MPTYIVERRLGGSVRTKLVRGDIKVAMARFIDESRAKAILASDRPKWDRIAQHVGSITPTALRSTKIETPSLGTISIVTAPSLGAWIIRGDTPPAGIKGTVDRGVVRCA